MLRRQEISVGKCYVNEKTHKAREVVEEIDKHRVKYNTFDLTTGTLISPVFQICFKSQIVYWADREAKPREIAMFHRFGTTPWFENVPVSDVKTTELEMTRSRMLEVVGHNNTHRC